MALTLHVVCVRKSLGAGENAQAWRTLDAFAEDPGSFLSKAHYSSQQVQFLGPQHLCRCVCVWGLCVYEVYCVWGVCGMCGVCIWSVYMGKIYGVCMYGACVCMVYMVCVCVCVCMCMVLEG